MKRFLSACLAVGLVGCASAGARTAANGPAAADSAARLAPDETNPFPSTYEPLPSQPTLIRGGTVMTAAGQVIPNGQVLLVDGKIAAVGSQVDAPAGVKVVDATGKFVTPGLIDIHSHLGVYPSPGVDALANGNEATNPTTPEVWAEHSVWPQDPGFARALAGGVTTLQILPGSANLIGGRSVVLKNVPARTVQAMKFPDAPYGMKMACGENPKRVYRNRGPSTLMGNMAGYRAAFIRAQDYKRKWDEWERNGRDPSKMPTRDLGLETLKGVLEGKILVQNHCYTADEQANMIDMFAEFGIKPRAFHHAVESYKIADLLAKDSIGAAMWADWWGFKMEALDETNANIALVDKAGARAMIHSDDPGGIQRLNQEVAKALLAGRQAGLEISDDEALRWATANPAWGLGLQDKIGTLEPGKNADVVIWDHHPFSVYARAQQVYIDGALVYDRNDPAYQPVSDFELGILPGEVR
jgi:imidazolonepropionase-like amidohydrolase